MKYDIFFLQMLGITNNVQRGVMVKIIIAEEVQCTKFLIDKWKVK